MIAVLALLFVILCCTGGGLVVRAERRQPWSAAAAEARWKRINAEVDAIRRCQCGAVGTIRHANPTGEGRCEYVHWMCDEHESVMWWKWESTNPEWVPLPEQIETDGRDP